MRPARRRSYSIQTAGILKRKYIVYQDGRAIHECADEGDAHQFVYVAIVAEVLMASGKK